MQISHVSLVYNSGSGQGRGREVQNLFASKCRDRNIGFEAFDLSQSENVPELVKKAVQLSNQKKGIVAAAGGDGTIRIVIHEARKLQIPVAAIPCGTFNLFARNHEISLSPEESIESALTGQPTPVQIAELNDETFILNASFGLYAKAIRERKNRTKKFGRNRFVAIASTLATMVKGHALMSIKMNIDGDIKHTRTTMVFIGNNALQLEGVSQEMGKCLGRDQLAVVTLKDMSGWKMFRLAFHGISKRLEKLDELDNDCAQNLEIESAKHQVEVALDGEMFQMRYPLKVKAIPDGVLLMKR